MQDERNIAFKSFISSDTHSSLINITSTGREKFHLPFFFFSLFIVFCTFSCNKVSYPFFYNQIHFHVENPFCLKLCLLRVQEKQGGGTVILIFLKNIHTRMYLAVRKRALGNHCWDMAAKGDTKALGATAGPGKRKQSWCLVHADSGRTPDSCCWETPQAGAIFSEGLFRESLSWCLTDFIWELNN